METGKLTLQGGGVYEGELVNGKPHGKGKFTGPLFDVYEGDFVDGKWNGKGKYTFPGTFVYEGDFTDGKIVTAHAVWQKLSFSLAKKE